MCGRERQAKEVYDIYFQLCDEDTVELESGRMTDNGHQMKKTLDFQPILSEQLFEFVSMLRWYMQTFAPATDDHVPKKQH